MRYAWVLTNVDGIVCAFDTEPTDDEVLDAVNHYYGDTGKFTDRYGSAFVWTSGDETHEYEIQKTELL